MALDSSAAAGCRPVVFGEGVLTVVRMCTALKDVPGTEGMKAVMEFHARHMWPH